MLRNVIYTLLFFVVPVALLATLLSLKWLYPSMSDPRLDLMLSAIGILALFSSITALAAAGFNRFQSRELFRHSESIAILQEINHELKFENSGLKNQVELLAAMREMALVTNDNTLFRESLGKIFLIMESLLECQSISLYLLDDEAKDLKARVYCDGTRTLFDDALPTRDGEEQLVQDAFDYRRSFSQVDAGVLTTCSPLIADHESVGVVQVQVDLSGDYEDQSEFIEKHQYRLEAIGKHISLPIRKSYLFDEATIDVMTKLYTKRHFLNKLAEAYRTASNEGKPYSLILCDIDHFKLVNDTYGHQSGDAVLKSVGEILLQVIRGTDTAYRYGGEEMAVLLLGSPGEKALEVAERIRSMVEAADLRGVGGVKIPITLSLGCREYSTDMKTSEEIVEAADLALYHCKENGRNLAALHMGDNPPTFEKPALVGLDRRQIPNRRQASAEKPAEVPESKLAPETQSELF